MRAKAVLLGACFLIDFMFFEKKANRDVFNLIKRFRRTGVLTINPCIKVKESVCV